MVSRYIFFWTFLKSNIAKSNYNYLNYKWKFYIKIYIWCCKNGPHNFTMLKSEVPNRIIRTLSSNERSKFTFTHSLNLLGAMYQKKSNHVKTSCVLKDKSVKMISILCMEHLNNFLKNTNSFYANVKNIQI